MENMLTSLGALPMFLLMFLVLYFVLIRPQIKEKKDKQSMIDNLKKGTGGMGMVSDPDKMIKVTATKEWEGKLNEYEYRFFFKR